MIEGLNQKDEELILNLVSGLIGCSSEERKALLKATLDMAVGDKITLFDDNGEMTDCGLFVGALREMILSFKGV